ncbi:tRNA modification GTPase GTPBP3, mitochondrial-like [Watersipora subatra]|uniref:tRNA modification GTPase GTPBP3, mitochondrial-like n=1 Tax=Watersipora subatra TaxID=2589382 RepID=UPI00355BFE91
MSEDIMLKMGRLSRAPAPRQALLRTVVCPMSQEKLDSGLLLWFPSPNSFTGEDCLEMQVHGGLAVVTAILRSLNSFPSTRHATAGEFTKRAFMNGKLDLTEVEGLADVIHAETEAQRKQAFRQMAGELNAIYSSWREVIVKCTASVEAYIDFSEEENIEDGVIEEVKTSLNQLCHQLERHLVDGRRGQRLRDGVHIAILGRPNVGKSSLINYVSRRPVAIVSPIEGTTRDSIESFLDLNGYPIVMADTAGLRNTTDIVESQGVQRAVNRSKDADLLVVMLSVTDLESTDDLEREISGKVTLLIDEYMEVRDVSDKSIIIVINKVDMNPRINQQTSFCFDTTRGQITISSLEKQSVPVVFTSITQEQGLDAFISQLTGLVKSLCADPSTESPSFTQARHRDHLSNCLDSIGAALNSIDTDVVVTAECLRLACVEIGQISGKISTEDILDVVFKDFCIGK